MLTSIRRLSKVYRTGETIRLKRRWKRDADPKLKLAEAQFAWQAALGVSLAIIFVGIPWSWNMIAYAKSINRKENADGGPTALQQAVYEERLKKRRLLQEASSAQKA